MIRFESFDKSHFDLLQVQDEQKHELTEAKFDPKHTFSLFWDDQILGVFGFWQLDTYRYTLIALIDKRSGRHMLSLVRTGKKMIEAGAREKQAQRIEAFVVKDFVSGARLMQLLGFQKEGCLRKLVKGFDYDIWARIF